MSKNIIVCADGTGNASSTQDSNVWRLYSSLDQSYPDQIAHYIKGVGSSEGTVGHGPQLRECPLVAPKQILVRLAEGVRCSAEELHLTRLIGCSLVRVTAR